MGHAFAADPTRQAAALIRPGSPALVVFRDQTELAWLRWLARGFRHCAVVVRVGGDWVLIDSLSHSICVGRFAAEPISGLAARYRAAGSTRRTGRANVAMRRRRRSPAARRKSTIPIRCIGGACPCPAGACGRSTRKAKGISAPGVCVRPVRAVMAVSTSKPHRAP